MSANFRKYYLKPCPITKFGIIAHVLSLISHVLLLTAHVFTAHRSPSLLVAHKIASLQWQVS